MSKKVIYTILAVTMIVLAAGLGFAGGQSEGGGGAEGSGEGEYDPIVVLIWSGPEYDNLRSVAERYEEQTGNPVIVEEVAREALQEKVTTVLVSGSRDYDVLYIDSATLPGYVEGGLLANLSTFINDSDVVSPNFSAENLEPGISFLSVDGNVYGLPSEGDTAWLFYRRDLLEEAGLDVPQTWDEFLAAAKELNNPPDRYGAVIGARRDEAMWDFMHYFFGFGGQIFDRDTYEVTINNDVGVEALDFYGSLLREHGVVTPDVTTYGYNEILSSLQNGRAAMGVEWMAATDSLTDPEVSPMVHDKLEYTLVPGVRDSDGNVMRGQGGSQWGWVVPAESTKKEAAYKFIEWLTGTEGGKLWALNGGIPSNTAVLSDPEVVEEVPQFELLAEAMPYRNIMPLTTVSVKINDAFGEAAHRVVATDESAEALADEAASRIEEALREGGYLE